MEYQSRIVTPDQQELKNMGWPRTYKRLDVYAVGKWRSMGYFKGSNGLKRILKDAQRTIAINTGIGEARTGEVTILEPKEEV